MRTLKRSPTSSTQKRYPLPHKKGGREALFLGVLAVEGVQVGWGSAGHQPWAGDSLALLLTYFTYNILFEKKKKTHT